MSNVEKANNFFTQKFHCSQAVLAAFAEDLGISEEQALKISGCFGGGMCIGEVCGAVTGGLMAIGLKYGQSKVEDLEARQKTKEKTVEFIKKFQETNGSYLCRELLKYDLANPDELKIIQDKQLFTTICPKMVESATRMVEELMND